MIEKRVLDLIKLVLWNSGSALADRDTYAEMKLHAIASLAAPCLSSLALSPELEREWRGFIIHQLSFNIQNSYEQSRLPITVPYVILKGTSAAQYYPHPEYRTMGDIDIMTRRGDFDTACKQLVDGGYRIVSELYKETALVKNGISIDLHRQFASLNDPDDTKRLDDLIINNIGPSHVLPDPINGLVLLQHINQHLEGGLGLRQIIDWMMFVDKCLPDDKWPEFRELSESIGLAQLAVVCTRMCEMYLGLPERAWCADADPALCDQLMEYVLSCGNFGNKKTLDSDSSESVLMNARTPRAFFKLLQSEGVKNWKAANEHRLLRPFAWIYQFVRYLSKGLDRKQAFTNLKKEYVAARKRSKMFDALGVKTSAKGLVIYKDGKYVKE